MKKPLIGVTASHDTKANGVSLRSNYLEAIHAFGGIPVVLPLELTDEEMEQLADTLDGILFTGGPDIHPFHFGEETLAGCGDASPVRDTLELFFFSRMYQRRKPILGICRGAQLINIALGGTLYQDIHSQLKDRPPLAHLQPFSYKTPCHRVEVVSETLLEQITRTLSIDVNSMHHQAIKEPAPGLTVCGRASDGIIEAVEMSDYSYLLGVQWHPEFLTDNCDHARSLFTSFIRSCERIV